MRQVRDASSANPRRAGSPVAEPRPMAIDIVDPAEAMRKTAMHSEPNKENTHMQRYGLVLKVRPEAEQEYIRYHADVWPEVLDMIRQCNIRNYSIYLKDGFLFSY